MSPETSTLISAVFLLVGGGAAVTMMFRLGRQASSRWLTILHRICGWTFAIIYFVMVAVMLGRMEHYWEELSPLTTIHCTFSVLLFTLIVAKLLIPRFFPGLAKYLFPLGFSVFLTAFCLVGISGGFFLLRKVQRFPYISHADLSDSVLDVSLGRQLFITKCSTCHVLNEILDRRSAAEWERTVNRMLENASPRISPGEGKQILHFLVKTRGEKD